MQVEEGIQKRRVAGESEVLASVLEGTEGGLVGFVGLVGLVVLMLVWLVGYGWVV